MELEGAALRVPGRAVAVVVEPGFADRDAARMRSVAPQLVLVEQLRVVRMTTNRRIDAVKGLGRRERLRAALRVSANGDDSLHPGRARGFDQRGIRLGA